MGTATDTSRHRSILIPLVFAFSLAGATEMGVEDYWATPIELFTTNGEIRGYR